MYVLDLHRSYSTFSPVIDHRLGGIKLVDPGGSEEEEAEMEEQEQEQQEKGEKEKQWRNNRPR